MGVRITGWLCPEHVDEIQNEFDANHRLTSVTKSTCHQHTQLIHMHSKNPNNIGGNNNRDRTSLGYVSSP